MKDGFGPKLLVWGKTNENIGGKQKIETVVPARARLADENELDIEDKGEKSIEKEMPATIGDDNKIWPHLKQLRNLVKVES